MTRPSIGATAATGCSGGIRAASRNSVALQMVRASATQPSGVQIQNNNSVARANHGSTRQASGCSGAR